MHIPKVTKLLSKKQVGVPLLVVSTAAITALLMLVASDHGKRASILVPVQTSASREDNDSDKLAKKSTAGQATAVTAGNPTTTASNPSVTTTQPTPTKVTPTPAPTPPVANNPTPAPTPSTPIPSIVFSADGCYVTVTGSAGWKLAGEAGTSLVNGVPRKGGPLGTPDGYIIPASGYTTIEVGYPGSSWGNWLLDASLYDESGNVMLKKSLFVDPTAAKACP